VIGAVTGRVSWTTLLLGVLCLAFAGIITIEWRNWEFSAAPIEPSRAGGATPSTTAPNFVMPALSTYGEVASRPLFSPTRRPSEDAPVATAPTTSMKLVAIVISHRRGPHALIRHGTPPAVDRVVEGQTIDNWTVETINFDRVILHSSDSTLELVPVDGPLPPPANPPNQPPAPLPQTPPRAPPTAPLLPRPTPPTPPIPPRA
jgi:hypothetical protein